MEEMSADEARRNWSGLLDRAHWQGDIGITRNGKPWVVVVSRDWYDAVVTDIHLLRAEYVVGHKDGDPLNNDPGNLEIIKRPGSEDQQ